MSDYEFKDELEFVNRLNEDDELFEREFNNVRRDFPFKDCKQIHDFLSRNRGVIVLLKNTKPLLKKYAPYASVHLELDVDPIFVPQLLVVVKALEHDFNNGFKEDISSMRSDILPLKSKLGLNKEFFIYDKFANEDNISALTFLDMCLIDEKNRN
ncbi:hypothetical protein [Methanobrevibacter sp.]|uniref:hypothetical protein n=1 Tax=Methanobrevibacter sp. TaxID=66852 RepID=UPI00389072BE